MCIIELHVFLHYIKINAYAVLGVPDPLMRYKISLFLVLFQPATALFCNACCI